MVKVVIALLLCCAAATVQARVFHQDALSGRSLLAGTINERCPAGCATEGCVLDSTTGGYKCMRCQGTLVVNTDDGTCGCPAGRYGTTNDCTDCDKGYWCAGGQYTAPDTPVRTDCGVVTGLSTIGKRSTSIKSCVNIPGYFYTVDSGTPGATVCPVNTYGPGWRKQRACVPCAPGYTTNGFTQRTSVSACVVPEGYYLKGPGQVAPCPKGEYKTGFAPAPACDKCATGVSTPNEASIAVDNCTVLLPTYYPFTIVAGTTGNIITLTKKCPQKFICPGAPSVANAFNPATLTVTGDQGIHACADGTWTQEIGSYDDNQCMTPPGYKTTVGGGSTGTVACGSGEYRADWKPAVAATSCDACGASINSTATDEITAYDPQTANPSQVYVRASPTACFIKPGQGMYYSPASGLYRAVNCESSNYGVANITYGLAAFPCRDCPAGMETSKTATPSNNSYVVSGDGVQGFINPMACVTKVGFGYNGRVANKCPVGSYNPGGNYGTCTQCAAGLSTPDDATHQATSANCKLAVGYGFYNSSVVPCPVGTYNPALGTDTTSECTSCDPGLSTSQAGGRSSADCNVCSAGYGGLNCATPCGGNTYGVAGRSNDTDSACTLCPDFSTTFSFDYLAANQNYTPATVSRPYASSPGDCLAEFAQIVDAAWYMGGAATLVNVTNTVGVNNFTECVSNCQLDATCQYITFDYDAKQCFKRQTITGSSGDVLAFKAVVSGDITAHSLKAVKGKALASGSYTFWKDAGTSVGFDVGTAGPTSSLQACLTACDDNFSCAAVAMTGVTSATNTTAAIIGCTIIKGDASVATFKRSVTKTVATRLQLSAAYP